MVQLNFPQEIEVKTLTDYVAERLKINILYEQETANKKITIKSPARIPVESLLSRVGKCPEDEGLRWWIRRAGMEAGRHTKSFPNVAPAGEAAQAIEKYGRSTPSRRRSY